MAYVYDDNNIFARILRGEIPNKTVFESEHSLAFHDISTQAPVHVLIIPKGRYVNYDDFACYASAAEIIDYTRAIGQVCQRVSITPEFGHNGYRLITNAGQHGLQEVPHLHVHVLGGRMLGRILKQNNEN